MIPSLRFASLGASMPKVGDSIRYRWPTKSFPDNGKIYRIEKDAIGRSWYFVHWPYESAVHTSNALLAEEFEVVEDKRLFGGL